MSGLVSAEFTRRATVVTPDVSGLVLDTPAIVQAAQRVREEQAAMEQAVRTAEDETLPAYLRRRARYRIDEVDSSRASAQADCLRAVRAANPDADSAAVEYAGRSTALLLDTASAL